MRDTSQPASFCPDCGAEGVAHTYACDRPPPVHQFTEAGQHLVPREVIAAHLRKKTGDDPQYDDGLDADEILAALDDAGFDVLKRA